MILDYLESELIFHFLDEKQIILKHRLMFVDISFYQNQMKYEDFYPM